MVDPTLITVGAAVVGAGLNTLRGYLHTEDRHYSVKKLAGAIIISTFAAIAIAQTIAVTCLGLGIKCHLTGLHTLKIKETDRLLALKNEIEKLGGKISVTNDSLSLEESIFLKSDCEIATYNDHRMAMSFAPLALKTSLQIADPMVVSKSYPTFWDDLKSIGFKISK